MGSLNPTMTPTEEAEWVRKMTAGESVFQTYQPVYTQPCQTCGKPYRVYGWKANHCSNRCANTSTWRKRKA